jgi:hypothetical protein
MKEKYGKHLGTANSTQFFESLLNLNFNLFYCFQLS